MLREGPHHDPAGALSALHLGSTGIRSLDLVACSPAASVTDNYKDKSGFAIARLRCTGQDTEFVNPPLPDHVIFAYLRQPKDVEAAIEAPVGRISPRIGDVMIGPAGNRARWIVPHGDGDALHMHISPERLNEIAMMEGTGGLPIELIPKLVVRDDLIAGLARRLMAEVQQPGFASAILLDSMKLALAVRLIRAHSTAGKPLREPHTALAPYRLKKAKEHIEANFAEDISLQSVAEAAGLSTFHFARAFKGATGLSPYRYVVARRVARATDLLAGTDLELSQIALDCGFSSQQQFTKMFRQATGLTPGQFRRHMR